MSTAEQVPERRVDAGLELSLRIGQRVRHRDFKGKRVTGVVRGLSIDSNEVLEADIALDAPLVIPARSADDREISIWRQHVPAHELTPFDERDELVAEMLAALQAMQHEFGRTYLKGSSASVDAARAVIAKATGSEA